MRTHYDDRQFKNALTLQTEGTDPAHAVTKEYVDSPPVYTIEVDPVLGDDTNDGVSAPVKTLYRASQFRGGKYGMQIFLKAGTHVLHNFGDWEDPEITIHDQIGFGDYRNPVWLRGEVVVEDTFTTLSSGGGTNTITKDSSTPDWTPGEHAGRFIRYDGYGLYRIQYVIIDNTATVLELAAYDPSSMIYPFPVFGEDAEIVSNAATIKPAPVNGSWWYFYARSELVVESINFDGESTWQRCLDMQYGASGFTHIQYCTFKNATNGIWGKGLCRVVGCYFKDLTGTAISHWTDSIRIEFCYFDNCGTAVSAGWGSYAEIMGFVGVKDTPRMMTVYGGAFIDYLGDAWLITKLDNVQDFCQLTGRGNFRAPDQFTFMPGYESLTRYGFYLIDDRNTVRLHDSGASSMTPATSYFHINSDTISAADYVTDGADGDFPLFNSILDI